MRLLLKLRAEKFLPSSKVNKHTVQGLIYSLLYDTEFSGLHTKSGFKFFTYSDIFPSGDFYPHKEKTLIVSSPKPKFIQALYDNLRESRYVYLSDSPLRVAEVKKFKINVNGRFISGSPVVLQVDNKKNIYFSFKRGNTIQQFLKMVKENALKKYNAYYNDELTLEEEIFDLLQYKKEVVIPVKRGEKSFPIIGSVWSLLEKRIPKGYRKFYLFIAECGIGEKNSLGFGFLNVLR